MSDEKASRDVSSIISDIITGNKQFADNHSKEYFDKFRDSQTPEITLVACSDSRFQSDIFGFDSTNRIFTVRNIGNQLMSSFGSVDYGIYHLKTPLLLIMGHSHCGALKASLSGYADDHFDIIREADHLCLPVRNVKKEADFEKVWHDAVEINLDYQVKLAVKKYKQIIDAGKLTVIGAIEDFINAYGHGYGRVIIYNVNGDNDPERSKNLPALSGIKGENIFCRK